MPEEKEKIEDFMTLWKNKTSQENDQPSIIGETLIQLEKLKRENTDLRKKISDNVELLSKSEDVIKKLTSERERIRIENEESIMSLTMRANDFEKENEDLKNKVKDMVDLLMEKDDKIKNLSIQAKPEEPTINSELQEEISKKNERIELLQKKVLEMKSENENLQAQLLENLEHVKAKVEPIEEKTDKVLKPLPPASSQLPLEMLCQDLQADLNKYKKIIERLNQEKNQLKQALDGEGISFNVENLDLLKKENESLRSDLEKLQNSISKTSQLTSPDQSQTIKDLRQQLSEKDNIIAGLKMSQEPKISTPSGPMANLVEELQNTINKLKITLQEKDQKISELMKQ